MANHRPNFLFLIAVFISCSFHVTHSHDVDLGNEKQHCATYLHIIINVAWSCSVLYCFQASVSTSHLPRPQSLSGWTVWGWNLSGGEIFHTDPNWPRGPASLLCNQWGTTQSGHGDDHSHPSSALVKEGVELHLNAPSVPTWHVTGWTLNFHRTQYYQCCHVQLLPEPSLNSTNQPRYAA
jgi:hypothetical protein